MNRYLIIKEIKENLYRQRQKIKINNQKNKNKSKISFKNKEIKINIKIYPLILLISINFNHIKKAVLKILIMLKALILYHRAIRKKRDKVLLWIQLRSKQII